jgi:hypothetical protein
VPHNNAAAACHRVSASLCRPPPLMDREARRRACVELRVKLSRDAGTNLTAAFCEALLDLTVECEGQGLALVHFSAQPQPFLTLNTSPDRLNLHPRLTHPVNTP